MAGTDVAVWLLLSFAGVLKGGVPQDQWGLHIKLGWAIHDVHTRRYMAELDVVIQQQQDEMRRVLEPRLAEARARLPRVQQVLKAYQSKESPTRTDLTFTRFLESHEQTLRSQIEQLERQITALSKVPKTK